MGSSLKVTAPRGGQSGAARSPLETDAGGPGLMRREVPGAARRKGHLPVRTANVLTQQLAPEDCQDRQDRQDRCQDRHLKAAPLPQPFHDARDMSRCLTLRDPQLP